MAAIRPLRIGGRDIHLSVRRSGFLNVHPRDQPVTQLIEMKDTAFSDDLAGLGSRAPWRTSTATRPSDRVLTVTGSTQESSSAH